MEVKQQQLFYYEHQEPENKPKTRKEREGFYWVQTHLIRESGPWYFPAIKQPEDVERLMKEHLDMDNCDRERLVVICLDRKGNINAVETASIGTLSISIIHPREVYKIALMVSAASIILVHNHPSGDPSPSTEDIEMTKRLISAGEILGIDVLDHVIIGVGRYCSLKGRGII